MLLHPPIKKPDQLELNRVFTLAEFIERPQDDLKSALPWKLLPGEGDVKKPSLANFFI
jgi:hypothetical protein